MLPGPPRLRCYYRSKDIPERLSFTALLSNMVSCIHIPPLLSHSQYHVEEVVQCRI